MGGLAGGAAAGFTSGATLAAGAVTAAALAADAPLGLGAGLVAAARVDFFGIARAATVFLVEADFLPAGLGLAAGFFFEVFDLDVGGGLAGPFLPALALAFAADFPTLFFGLLLLPAFLEPDAERLRPASLVLRLGLDLLVFLAAIGSGPVVPVERTSFV